MKNFLTLIFILFALINLTLSDSIDDDTFTFNELKDNYMMQLQYHRDHPVFGSLVNSDKSCINEKLKIHENGEKEVRRNLGSEAVKIATILCHKNPYRIFDAIFKGEMQINKLNEEYKRNLNCIKLKLKEIDPNSDLIENFEISQNEIENCKENSEVLIIFDVIHENFIRDCNFDNTEENFKANLQWIVTALTQEENSDATRAAMLQHRILSIKNGEKLIECALKSVE
ncbi:hypothetical protein PVAND_017348 [Polypedilum vanderplanki]|uniref:Secreted protein n=1 Tax=Polypedilum vanderplanki TaxID=319348 RepID=A0A9J6BI09_POLVA|nr:hypothetical protein PVAND_017348 [Polypedilum vanderplanki]